MVNAQWGTKKKKKITSTDVKTWHQVFVEKIGIVINNKQRHITERVVISEVLSVSNKFENLYIRG